MGADAFTGVITGHDPERAFRDAVEESRYDYGAGGERDHRREARLSIVTSSPVPEADMSPGSAHVHIDRKARWEDWEDEPRVFHMENGGGRLSEVAATATST